MRRLTPLLASLAAAAVIAACGDNDTNSGADRILVYSRTLGYRHADAIAAGGAVLAARLNERGIGVDLTEDPARFTPEALARYRAVCFLYTSGNDILDAGGKAALEAFVRGGGGWIGIHSAADTEYDWPFYRALVVAPFASHPEIQQATVTIEDHSHPATAALSSAPWIATDEWYNFALSPRGQPGVHVLATVDETSYSGGTMGADHPVIWWHDTLGGRAFYSALGHAGARWHERAFVDHVAGAACWVMRLCPPDPP